MYNKSIKKYLNLSIDIVINQFRIELKLNLWLPNEWPNMNLHFFSHFICLVSFDIWLQFMDPFLFFFFCYNSKEFNLCQMMIMMEWFFSYSFIFISKILLSEKVTTPRCNLKIAKIYWHSIEWTKIEFICELDFLMDMYGLAICRSA